MNESRNGIKTLLLSVNAQKLMYEHLRAGLCTQNANSLEEYPHSGLNNNVNQYFEGNIESRHCNGSINICTCRYPLKNMMSIHRIYAENFHTISI